MTTKTKKRCDSFYCCTDIYDISVQIEKLETKVNKISKELEFKKKMKEIKKAELIADFGICD